MKNEANVEFCIDKRVINHQNPCYFIADIAANHDGDLSRAKDLIYLAKEAGADAAKFQHFKAETIVSDYGFKSMGSQQSHQSKWKKSVYEVYQGASVSTSWTSTLKETCDDAGISFFTSPYDFDLVDHIDDYVNAYKIGSGDITWIEMIEKIASKNKPYILASGASSIEDVDRAVSAGLAINQNLALLQCNTNYTGSVENMKYVQLNVLKTYKERYSDMILGLSDHTPGHATVLGAISLGAKIIEKHFTDNTLKDGPDHAFSMDPRTWRDMVDRARELEASLGSKTKNIEENEIETVVIQRRSIRSVENLAAGTILRKEDTIPLRPCPDDALPPYEIHNIVGKKLKVNKLKGDYFSKQDFE
jgi:sialic acid synthase SpsE